MLTVLSIEKKKLNQTFLQKFFVNSLMITERTGEKADIRYLKYVCRNGKINWRRISKKAGKGRENLIFGEKDSACADCGIVPFRPYELRQRLCGNMALEVLEIMGDMPSGFRIGLYDPQGDFFDLCHCILKFTSNFTVVTHNKSLYTAEARRLLEENGVVLCVCSKVAALSGCGLIIAPSPLREPFVPMTKAVVLTSSKPFVPLGCRVYTSYSFSLPKEFEELRPQDVPVEIFGGALYSCCSIHDIGSCVPFLCVGDTDAQTTLSLRKYFTECFGT